MVGHGALTVQCAFLLKTFSYIMSRIILLAKEIFSAMMFGMSKKALELAIEKAGGQASLARKIGTSQELVYFWLRRSKKGITPEFVLRIEDVTGVSRHLLRPDIYPRERERATKWSGDSSRRRLTRLLTPG
jgi:DNA-binding transcriptional regulator YdaS (Cro superfamily)